MTQPLNVTVITASYNSIKYLEETIKSIATQSQMPRKHLIIDDCSTDGSYELAITLAKHYNHVEVIRHETNKGFPSALNTGIKTVKTDFIAILDSDDIAKYNWLEKHMNILEDDQSIGVVGCGGVIMSEKGEVSRKIDFEGRDDTRIKKGKNPFLHPGTIWRKSILDKYGNYDSSMQGWEDTEIFMRIAPYTNLIHSNENLIYYRLRPSSLSAKMRPLWPILRKTLLKRYQFQMAGMDIDDANNKVSNMFLELKNKRDTSEIKLKPYQYDLDIASAFKSGGQCLKASAYYLSFYKKGGILSTALLGIVSCIAPPFLVKKFKRTKL